jgi:hypothetical protein
MPMKKQDIVDFIKALFFAFISVWLLLLTPVLIATGEFLLFLAKRGEYYLSSEFNLILSTTKTVEIDGKILCEDCFKRVLNGEPSPT